LHSVDAAAAFVVGTVVVVITGAVGLTPCAAGTAGVVVVGVDGAVVPGVAMGAPVTTGTAGVGSGGFDTALGSDVVVVVDGIVVVVVVVVGVVFEGGGAGRPDQVNLSRPVSTPWFDPDARWDVLPRSMAVTVNPTTKSAMATTTAAVTAER
jgi:hypothetical protein